jgi:rubrerythrin
MDAGASLVGDLSNLKLKERAWKVIRRTAEPVEAQYLADKEQETQRRLALENAWDHYYSCPTCGVAFGAEEEKTCRVCGTARPEAPQKPDPRKPG